MCFFNRKKCVWNDSHKYGFHDGWYRNIGSFSLPSDHKFLKMSVRNPLGSTPVTYPFNGGGTTLGAGSLSSGNKYSLVGFIDHNKTSF